MALRSAVIAAMGLGSVIFVPQAVAGSPCPDGTARIFFEGGDNHCQAGSASFSSPRWVSKVCSVGPVKVTVRVEYSGYGARPLNRELDPGHCAQIPLPAQKSASVVLTPV
ncbi:hypothetical protein [Nocardia sp. XZ_19_385]|uniref:hypothetical protein n=1 Tax=Nocardia sp. XZ_19_385 TaxID=2769488 RepID=UPI00188E57EB|nr:hypothetical protein [Nocardia sp. XZ_19_385]